MFLENLTAKTATISDADKRKTVTYRDVGTNFSAVRNTCFTSYLANTVATDNRLFFLQELIPKTIPLVEALEHQRRRRIELGEGAADMDEDSEHPPSGDADDRPEDMDEDEGGFDRGDELKDGVEMGGCNE